jgi:hypothetical protein
VSDEVAQDAVRQRVAKNTRGLLEILRGSILYGAGRRRNGSVVFVMDGPEVAYVYDEATLPEKVTVVCPDCGDDGGYCATCGKMGRVQVSRARAVEEGLTIYDERSERC